MAVHSSILAWETPWTGEPGGLPSVRSQKSGTHLATEQQQWFGCTLCISETFIFPLYTHTYSCVRSVCVCVCVEDERLSDHLNIWGSL